MIIEEVEVYNILGCKQLTLNFNSRRRSSVYVVQNNDDPQSHHLLTLAVQLLCSSKYANLSFCTDPIFDNIKEGFARIKFILPILSHRHLPEEISMNIPVDDNKLETFSSAGSDKVYPEKRCKDKSGTKQRQASSGSENELDLFPCTSQVTLKRRKELHDRRMQQTECIFSSNSENVVQKFIVISACRDFRRSPNKVSYSVNNEPEESCSLAAFHGRFNICLDYMLPFLKNLSLDFNGDWLELLSSDLNERWNRRAKLEDPFERFVFLYHKYGYPEQHILSEVTRAHLSNATAMEALQKTYIIKILRDTRGMFEFITAGEYTVFFYIPHYGRYADVVLDVSVEDLNFEYMTTYIQDNSKLISQKYFWSNVQPAIKDMLLIAFQISLSFHCRQQIIFLSNFDEISNYQAIQFATTACFQKLGVAKPAWTNKNYLQRIVDVCINSGTTAIIEYPGGTPLHPVNAHLMKSFKITEAGNISLSLKIINDEKYSFEYFLECLEKGLKNV